MKQFGILALGSRLKRLSDYLFAEVQQVYVRRGIPISSTYFPILRLLQERGALSVVEVADKLGISHPAVSKQVAKMIQDRLLEKVGDSKDQRRSLLHLSEQGTEAMVGVEPVLTAIRTTLEALMAAEGGTFMTAFDAVEERMLASRFSETVLKNLTCSAFTVVPFAEDYRQDFAELNMAWLENYFPTQITEQDRLVLRDPENRILGRGGEIWFAVPQNDTSGRAVGTITLKPVSKLEYEIVKLAVDPGHQRQGVATLLLNTAIECAKIKGATLVSLETASSLKSALRLYQRFGFSVRKSPRPYSAARVDLYMALSLPASTPIISGDTPC